MTADLSLSEARRIALRAQGFDRARGPAGPAAVAGVIRRLGLLQIDFVNVVVPAHYMVLFSRLGPFKREALDGLIHRRRQFIEQWAHEASILPVEVWPLLRHRMETYRIRPYGFEKFLAEQPGYVEWVLQQVRERGPLAAADLPAPEGGPRRIPGAWFASIPRAVLEACFARGTLATAGRLPNAARLYDLAERVIPGEVVSRQVDRATAQRELLLRAASACGVGTAADLADYYRMPVKEARPVLDELVAAGGLRAVRVETWRETAYLHPEARPAAIDAAALLAPFDPVVWFRPRAARLFQFEYRFEVFTPQAKRKWGCYVLPFLLGDRLVARVDLKTDRAARRLAVLAAYIEPGALPSKVVPALADELRSMARWLDLDGVEVRRRGGLSPALAQELRRGRS